MNKRKEHRPRHVKSGRPSFGGSSPSVARPCSARVAAPCQKWPHHDKRGYSIRRITTLTCHTMPKVVSRLKLSLRRLEAINQRFFSFRSSSLFCKSGRVMSKVVATSKVVLRLKLSNRKWWFAYIHPWFVLVLQTGRAMTKVVIRLKFHLTQCINQMVLESQLPYKIVKLLFNW